MLAHELTHVVQQSDSGGLRLDQSRVKCGQAPNARSQLLQRAIKFESGLENITHSVVDSSSGRETRSNPLLEQFTIGAHEYLAIDLVTDTDGTSIVKAEINTAKEKEITNNFKKQFPRGGLTWTMLVGKDEYGRQIYEDKSYWVTDSYALDIWKKVRTQVVDLVEGGGVTIRLPKPGKEKIAAEHSPVNTTSGIFGDDIFIGEKGFKNMAIASDTLEAFDGFWILLHEMRHLSLPKKRQ